MDEIPAKTSQNTPPAPPLSSAGQKPAEVDWRDRGGWRHPYVLYILGTGLLFVFLMVMAYLASESGWIPSRGISHP